MSRWAGTAARRHDGGHARYAYRSHKQNAWPRCVESVFLLARPWLINACATRSATFRQGLYDPRHEHDACGVGFVVHVKGRRSHAIVRQALQVLINLEHRGACGCEANTGDGAGILIQMPDRFFRKEAARLGSRCPPSGAYGAGFVFLPKDADARARVIEATFERIVRRGRAAGARLARRADRRQRARSARGRGGAGLPAALHRPRRRRLIADGDAFERKLYVIRKRVEHAVDALALSPRRSSRSTSSACRRRTLIYKGMLTASQIAPLFPDLSDRDVESALALVHQRFSTNTFPSWPLAHPTATSRTTAKSTRCAATSTG